MSNAFVRIREIGIHRVPGIRRGEGFRLDDLSPGINIVFGPNGAGKSTTCRVVQELLWPGTLERPSVEGVVDDADCEWRIEIDAGHAQCLRDGRPGAAPEWGPSENRVRYHLGLKQFITGRNEEFAARIVQASQGGYDLDAAAGELGYSSRPTAPRKDRDLLQNRENEVIKAASVQREIEHEAHRLDALQAELEEAAEAERRLVLLKKVDEYRRAVERCRRLEAERDAYPDGLERLHGDEQDRLDALDEKENELRRQLAAEEERLRRSSESLGALVLPDDGIPEEIIRELRARKNELRDLETEIAEQRRRRNEAAAEAERALRVLGDAFTDDQLAALTRLENPDLDALARRADRVRAERAALDARRRWLQSEEPDEARSIDANELQNGINTLAHWLAAAGDARRTSAKTASWRVKIAASGTTVLALALGVLQEWIWAAMALLAAVALVVEWLWARKRDGAGSDDRTTHRRIFEQLSLPQPEAWEADAVARHLRSLNVLAGKKALASERRQRLEALKADVEALEEKEAALERQRAELERQLACTIEIGDEWLPVLVGRISDWQAASAARDAADRALESLVADRDALLEKLNASLAEYGEMRAESAAAADEFIAELAERRRRHAAATQDAREARRRIEESIRPDLDRLRDERSALFDRLQIGPGQEALVTDWLARREDYLKCKKALDGEATLRDDRRTALDGHEDLLELDETELRRRIREAEDAAARRDDLSRRIGAIERSIEEAKSGHALSDALAARDEARDRLARAREENGRARVGAALTDWVREVAVERSRPQVFQRADELFVRFTRGTLHLEMDDRATPPAFVARRGRLPVQSLDQLSDGERVQLMTAVRLAFLEQDETKPLPLLVDEVLGTSDDARSEVMIDTMIEVARQGRQVFYCTAQHDEVGKWIARLEEENVDFRLHDLAEIRNLAAARTKPLEIDPIEKSLPPAPDGMAYHEYGRELGVPGIDPETNLVERVHLWHLFDDAATLHELLSRDISTWGQLETLLERGGAGLIECGNGTFGAARAAARALEEACRAWRVGRGKPVDRAALLDSGCVTDTFIDDVARLADCVGGNAQQILAALERGEVRRFRSSNIESLREYFETEGYLPLEPPLKPDDLRVRVMAVTSDELRKGVLRQHVVDRIISSVAAP